MYLGLDIGTGSVKALLVGEGTRLSAQAAYPADASGAEQAAASVAETVKTAILQIVRQLGGRAHEIRTVGLCGHGPSIVFVNRRGEAATPIVTWQDHRAMEEAGLLAQQLPGFAKDGTSYEAKLLWYFRRQPALFEGQHYALYPKDYLIYLLTGRFCVDGSTASAIAFYQPEQDSWENAFVPAAALPPVVQPWEVAGLAETPFAQACGLPPGTRVVMGGIDCFCEAVGAGGFGPEVVVDGTGTSTCLTRAVLPGVQASRHVLPGYGLQVRMLSSTGAAFKWFSEQVGGNEMEALLKAVDPGLPQKLLFLPYLNGERSPVWDEKARGVYAGLSEETTRGQMLQALLQGVGFALRQNLEEMNENEAAGRPVSCVHAVGGGNRNEAWLQIKADICGLPYKKLSEADASALGAALVGALGGGHLQKEELDSFVSIEKVFLPSGERAGFYLGLYEAYTRLYPALQEIFSRMYAL